MLSLSLTHRIYGYKRRIHEYRQKYLCEFIWKQKVDTQSIDRISVCASKWGKYLMAFRDIFYACAITKRTEYYLYYQQTAYLHISKFKHRVHGVVGLSRSLSIGWMLIARGVRFNSGCIHFLHFITFTFYYITISSYIIVECWQVEKARARKNNVYNLLWLFSEKCVEWY